MTVLSVYNQNHPQTPVTVTEDPEQIQLMLNEKGVRYEQWPTKVLPANASQDDILEAYAEPIRSLQQDCGFQSADVISLTADHPDREAFRNKFIDEHTHSEDEVRFFVHGQGLFYLHFGESVYAVMCQKNDLISVPEGTRHWFDMGPEPDFTCIRLFTSKAGWVASFTGEDIAEQVPRYEAISGTA